MCGLAGMSGVKSADARLKLVISLGGGIDARGGHAAGYVTLPSATSGAGVKMAKRIGTWDKAALRFSFAAARGEATMMHSRFATCGSKDNVEHAHPFAIKRDGKSVLYGAHNGVISGTYLSAREHQRDHTVDSKEVFELLADGDIAAIRKLEGYGVLTWITPESGDINLVRLSKNADLVVAKLKGDNGYAYASTWTILSKALAFAGLEAEHTMNVDAVGQVFHIRPSGMWLGSETKLTVAEDSWRSRSYSHYDYSSLYGTGSGSRKRVSYADTYSLADWDDEYNYRDLMGNHSDVVEYTEEDRAYDASVMAAAEADEWERIGRWSSNGKLLQGPKQETANPSIAEVVRTDPAFRTPVVTKEMTKFQSSDGVRWRRDVKSGQWHKATQQQALLDDWEEVKAKIATDEPDHDKQRAMRLEAFKILQARATRPIAFSLAAGVHSEPVSETKETAPDTLPSSAITTHEAAAEE